MEQTVYLGSGLTSDIIVYVQSISSAGSHVPLVVDTSTTKLVFASGSQSSVVPSVTSLGTGKAKITFASVTNSGNLAAGDSVAVKVNGTADSVAFSEYLIPVFIDSAGGGGGSAPTEAQMYTYFTTANRQDSFKADVTSLATSADLSVVDNNVDLILIDTGTDIPAQISALNNFDPASDVVTVGTNNDKTGYSISGTKQTLDSLNDIAATDIVSAGAITTLNGAVVNVDLVDVTTTNTDQRGTDNALLASSAPSNFGSLGINASGHILRTVLNDTTTTNTDMRGTDGANTTAPDNTSITAIKTKTDQLTFTVSNQVDANSLTGGTSPTDIYNFFTSGSNENAFKADVSALATSSQIVSLNDLSSSDVENAVWDASLSSHNTGGTTGKSLKQIKEGTITIESSINDTAATTTSFVTSLTETTTSYYSNKIMVFIDGNLSGQARIITNYNGTTKTITLEEPLTTAPADGDQFLILATHENSIEEIADGVWNELGSGHTTAGTFGYYLDAQVSAAGVTPPTASQIANAVWSDTQSSYTVDGTFGYYLDSQVSQAGAGGSGLYQLTVNVTDASSGSALQGARINVDGTTLTLTTDSAGQCVFNLDSGVYLLTISPPAGYDTVSSNTVTITTADTSSSFSLTETASSGDCDVPWVG